MYLSFQNNSFWESLHLKNGLEDWDIGEELKLTITTEESLQGLPAPDETPRHLMLQWHADPLAHECLLPGTLPDAREPGIRPHLWTWVNPSLVCPIPGNPGMDPDRSKSLVASVPDATETSPMNTSWGYLDSDCSKEDVQSSSSEAGKLTEDEDAFPMDTPAPQEILEIQEPKKMLMPQTSEVLRPQSKKLKCRKQTNNKTEGRWPRPPLNYCLLITLALRNSGNGSLTVQQIYEFTRQHFPFFETAPQGWKNTIRHNLCLRSCFKKATGFVCGNRNRKSCLWRLTPEGCRKFQMETQALPEEDLALVRQSMSNPDLMRSLFGL
ncbi:forkhead box protein R1 [Heliangelus exortis]|uniref:forkhead box protein R1 n=1 Tax=Heliangelus exortis TaxID=472823 RepID=UPI003A8DCDF6